MQLVFVTNIEMKQKKSVLPANIRRALDLVSGGTIANFKPMNARAVFEYICPTMWGSVLRL